MNISPQLVLSLAESTLLTANERLAREYRRAYALHQQGNGHRAWVTPDILSLRSFFLREFGQLALDDPGSHPTVIDQTTLINITCGLRPGTSSHLITNFLAAFDTVTTYDIPLQTIEDFTGASTFFAAWARDVKRELEGHFILPGEIPRYLLERQILPGTGLITATLEHLTPAEQSYFTQAVANRPISTVDSNGRPQVVARVEALLEQPPEAEAVVEVHAAPTFHSELAAAAQWARERLDADPESRVGIVVPSLAQDHAVVSRIVGAAFSDKIPDGSDTAQFDISAGEPLGTTAVWQAARLLLKLGFEQVNQAELWRIASCGFFGNLGLEDVLNPWPMSLRPEVNVLDLRTRLRPGGLLEALSDTTTHPQTFAAWLNRFADLLAHCGWPNLSAIGSRQYQAHQGLLETLREPVPSMLSRPETKPMTAIEALQRLDIRLERQIFAPERDPANLLVLGLLEANGLIFDHLWVCGLDEENFPNRNTGVPFLPRVLLRAHGVPRADQAAELAFSIRLWRRWQHQAKQLRVSYCRKSDNAERGRSRIFPASEEITLSPETPPAWLFTPTRLEPFDDRFGIPLADEHWRGGVSLLEDQAKCPFRAYAIHRLGIRRPEESSDLPDALTRGVVLHDALHALFAHARTQDKIAALSDADIQTAIQLALNKLKRALPQYFAMYETERLVKLIASWLAVEEMREEFEIHALESSYELHFGQLAITVRADRIDRLQKSGRLIIIDYKTGRVTTSNLTQPPLVNPQLPIYSLIDPDVYGAFYATVRSDGTQFAGISAPQGEPGNAKQVKMHHTWSDQISLWRDELERLAADFVEGNAAVTPTKSACEYCHLDAFCRIFEHDGAD